jgi:uncharacterized membrane protein YbaN (DUF454 family)
MTGMRAVFFTLGWVSVGLGVVGMALPLLPTVPFLLLAAVCFGRSSPAAHDWLTQHPRLGPPIEDWRAHGAIRRSVKRVALLTMVLSFAIPALLGSPLWVMGVQAVALGCVACFILTRPEGPEATP